MPTDKERAEFLEQHAKRTAIHYRQLAAKLTRYANQLEDPHAMEDRFPPVAMVSDFTSALQASMILQHLIDTRNG